MNPPFRFEQLEAHYIVLDSHGNIMADCVEKEFARLTCGLLNGHFGVPVIFHANPVNLTLPITINAL